MGSSGGCLWAETAVDTAFDRRVPAKPFVPRSFRPLPLVHPFYRFSIGVRHFLQQLVAAPLLIGSSFLSITLSLVYAHWKCYAHCTLHITCLPPIIILSSSQNKYTFHMLGKANTYNYINNSCSKSI